MLKAGVLALGHVDGVQREHEAKQERLQGRRP